MVDRMLLNHFSPGLTEAGCDEAGRGCLAGPVFAAAVIFPGGYTHPDIRDSKTLTAKQRQRLRGVIENDALAWCVARATPEEIDSINILNASFLAMHRAIDRLGLRPELLLIDGNRFNPYPGIGHRCIIRGDGKYLSIAAASILAKSHRDQYMLALHEEYPWFDWASNKGYPCPKHLEALLKHGPTIHHRSTFHYKGQLKLIL